MFICRVASGVADLVVRELRHRAERRWSAPAPGAPPPEPPGNPTTENAVNGDAHGVVVQAGTIGQVHIHAGPRPPGERPPHE
ncbi:hypothetical protein ACIBFB_08260 [Nocardiopsis sp. NPDC050513]|uniref:hypothetical protein n=1 Tax=Nocardiopsis sp. NPDC050513 TaxID=3364338 RepID=UPI0037A896D8